MKSSPRFRSLLLACCLGGGPLWLALSAVEGCGQRVEVGVDDALGAGGTLQAGGTTGGGDAGQLGHQGGVPACAPTPCRGKYYQCGNCDDDDGDGFVDALDPECLGPCDDDEAGLSSGLSASPSGACRQDCYFDGDNGLGNDQCQWSHACDPLSLAPDYPPSGEPRCEYLAGGQGMGTDCLALSTEQPAACIDKCLPVVPNGCDCFGCCELPGGSGEFHFIGKGRGEQGCQLDRLSDLATCPPCTPVESCFNECGECETCVGRTAPASCSPASLCPPGQAACTSDAPCDFGEYCVTGCCVRAPEPT